MLKIRLGDADACESDLYAWVNDGLMYLDIFSMNDKNGFPSLESINEDSYGEVTWTSDECDAMIDFLKKAKKELDE